MGREIRRVPANWEHPRYTEDTAPRSSLIGEHTPLHDDYPKALNEFAEDIKKMGLGEAIDYHGGGPTSDGYVHYGDKPCDWWQAYETVSEGTPVSPAFATAEELIEHLAKHGDSWAQKRGAGGLSRAAAEAFVRGGWAPSAMLINGKVYENAEGLVH